MEPWEELKPEEARLLISAPELFAILYLGEKLRPWRAGALMDAVATWRLLPEAQAKTVLGFGWMLQRQFELIPVGLSYPKTPIWRLPRDEAMAWGRKFEKVWLDRAAQGEPIPDFFEKTGFRLIPFGAESEEHTC